MYFLNKHNIAKLLDRVPLALFARDSRHRQAEAFASPSRTSITPFQSGYTVFQELNVTHSANRGHYVVTGFCP